MPSLGDSIFIFVLALMLFGPKKLPQLARQLGKLMAEFRRASNDFRMQMEDELRIDEQKEHQKKVDAMAGPPSSLPEPEHPHLPRPAFENADVSPEFNSDVASDAEVMDGMGIPPEMQPIAESGDLRMMPPSTGLPVERVRPSENSNLPPEHIAHHVHEEQPLAPMNNVGMSSEEPASEAAVNQEGTHA